MCISSDLFIKNQKFPDSLADKLKNLVFYSNW